MARSVIQRFFSSSVAASLLLLAVPANAQNIQLPQQPFQQQPVVMPGQPAAQLPPIAPAPQQLPMPGQAQQAPLGTPAATAPEAPPANLMERILSILGNRNLPRIDIPAPDAGGGAALAPKRARSNTTNARAGMTRMVGVEVGRNFLPIYGVDSAPDATPMVMPFFATAPLNQPYPMVTTMIIMLHDGDREAAKAYAFARSAQDEAATRHPEWNADAAFIVAPQFLEASDIEAQAGSWPDGGDALLRWAPWGWLTGQESVAPAAKGNGNAEWAPRRGMSSFEVMDFALLTLARRQVFPNLRTIVLAGSGFGADFVQRYAVLGAAPDILAGENVQLRFALAHTRTFLYLDARRARQVAAGTSPGYADEVPVFSEALKDECRLVNAYPFGMDGLPSYGKRQGETEIRLRYSARKVAYLAGEGATLPMREATPDACAQDAQGGNLKARTQTYFSYLEQLYGSELVNNQRRYLVPDVSEDNLKLWRSPCGTAVLFGDGDCPGATGNATSVHDPDDHAPGAGMQIIK